MPYTIKWHQPGKVIQSHFAGDISVEEMRESSAKAIEMFAEGTPPIHLVTDMSHVKKFSTNFLEIRTALPYLEHPSMGWHAFYGALPLFTSFINMYAKIVNVRVRTFKTYEQAIRFVAEQDSAVLVKTEE